MTSPFMTALKTKSPLVGDPSKGSPVYSAAIVEEKPLPSNFLSVAEIESTGKEAGQRLQALSLEMISIQKVDNTDVMQTKLNSLIKEAKGLTPDQSQGIGKVIKKLLGFKEDLFSHFDTASGRIGVLNEQLKKEFQIAEKSVDSLHTLKKGIGEFCLAIHRDIELLTHTCEALTAQYESIHEDLVNERVELRDNLDIIETKIVNLRGLESQSLKMGERLNRMLMTSKLMIISGKNVIDTAVPTYTANFSAYIESVKQKKFIEFNNSAIDNINEAIQLGSTIAKDNQIAAVKLVNKPIISLETLKVEQQNLIETLEETLKVSTQARLDRVQYLEEASKSDAELVNILK